MVKRDTAEDAAAGCLAAIIVLSVQLGVVALVVWVIVTVLKAMGVL